VKIERVGKNILQAKENVKRGEMGEMQNSECGMRNGKEKNIFIRCFKAYDSAFPTPHSAFFGLHPPSNCGSLLSNSESKGRT
jgi:hypothetical protein